MSGTDVAGVNNFEAHRSVYRRVDLFVSIFPFFGSEERAWRPLEDGGKRTYYGIS